MKSKPTYKTKMSWKSKEYKKKMETHKIPKEIKIGCRKINVEPYIPNPLRCYKYQRFGHHQDQCTQLPVRGRCREYDIHNDC